jgi:TDG/mug DNA glycosylase family protein
MEALNKTPDDLPRVRSFDAVLGDCPFVLILGSMPGVQSLESGHYYENPRNYFWRLISAVLGETEPENYEGRIAMLKRRHVAIWDSVRSCVRSGSLDKNIREEEHNDIAALLDRTPTIRGIGFNGRKAEKMYFKYNLRRENLKYLLLPSSSPVPSRMAKNFEDRLQKWLDLRQLLS